MVFARGSHLAHQAALSNGSWARLPASLSGLLEVLRFYQRLGDQSQQARPTLQPGDLVVFSKCTVHTSSGLATLRRPRYAWQLRFFADPEVSSHTL